MKSLGLVFFSLWLYFFNLIHIYNFISNIYIHRVRTRRMGTNNQIKILIHQRADFKFMNELSILIF